MGIPNPVTREDHYLVNIDKAINGEPLAEVPTPVTRDDHYLNNIGKALAGESLDTAPDPVTRVDHYLDKISKDVKSPVEVESLSVTENKTYTAPSGKAYSPVIVNVPTGGGGVPGVTVLHGTGTTPVELPTGFSFPAVADCYPDDPSDPFVCVYLVYLDAKGEDMFDGEVFRRVIELNPTESNSSLYYSASSSAITFTGGSSTVTATFTLANGGISFQSASADMATYSPSEQTDFLIVVVDMRP